MASKPGCRNLIKDKPPLARKERVTARKIALVFKKIEFMPPVENQKMRERFKEVAKELDK